MTSEEKLREIVNGMDTSKYGWLSQATEEIMQWHKSEMKKLVPETVRLKDRTDKYLIRTYNGKTIFVGLWSDTVTNESRDSIEDDL